MKIKKYRKFYGKEVRKKRKNLVRSSLKNAIRYPTHSNSVNKEYELGALNNVLILGNICKKG